MLKNPIYIKSIHSISALGFDKNEIWNNYNSSQHLFNQENFDKKKYWVSKINATLELLLNDIKNSESKYKYLDRSVLLGIFAARLCKDKFETQNIGINFGSSRGATSLFEKYHEQYIKEKKVSTYTSPATTLGNISSWIAHDLQVNGPDISHSITCSTGLHALLNGIAWLESGLSESFLIGASEAPLTPFTLAQMEALKIYALNEDDFPNRSLDFEKKHNSLVLGEGATAALLSKNKEKSIGKIIGIGFATEILSSGTSVSTDAKCLQKSMQMALKNIDLNDIDAIIMHAPGTIKGDNSEMKAIQNVFNKTLPALTSNKWKIGHTFACSGLLSLEMALLMLEKQKFISTPFINNNPKRLNKILINAVGFGGNAVSVVVSL